MCDGELKVVFTDVSLESAETIRNVLTLHLEISLPPDVIHTRKYLLALAAMTQFLQKYGCERPSKFCSPAPLVRSSALPQCSYLVPWPMTSSVAKGR